MLLIIFLPTGGPPTLVARPGGGVIVERPVDAASATVQRPNSGTVARPVDATTATVPRPGNGDVVERPDATTGATPWTH